MYNTIESTRVEITPEDINPWSIVPHGDRLLVEIIEISNETKVGEHTIHIAMAVRDHQGKLTEEYLRGFCAGIVMRVGSGEVLTTPVRTHAVPMHVEIKPDEISTTPNLSMYDTETKQGLFVLSTPARVPMPWATGDVILIERLAKRSLKIGTRTFAMVDQMDVLATVGTLKYTALSNGEWVNVAEEYQKSLFARDTQAARADFHDEELPAE